MSRRKYPSVAVAFKCGGNTPCEVCGKQSTHRVEMRVNWFRGDDERLKLCSEHTAEAESHAGVLMRRVYDNRASQSATGGA